MPMSPSRLPPGIDAARQLRHDVRADDDDGFELPAVPYREDRPAIPAPDRARPDRRAGPAPSSSIRRSIILYLVLEGGMAHALRRRARPRRLRMGRARRHPVEAALAEMDAAGRDGRARPEARTVQRGQWRHAAAASTTRSARARSTCSTNGEDTLYRLHGSPEWNSIGKSVSSGCVRLINQDVIDLYDRVPTRRR